MLKVIEEKVGYLVACACVLVACVVVLSCCIIMRPIGLLIEWDAERAKLG